MRYSSNFITEAKRGTIFPIIDVSMPEETHYWSTSSIDVNGLSYDGVVSMMGKVRIGMPFRPGQIGFPEFSFTVLEGADKAITQMLESHNVRKSPVTLKWASKNLAAADFATLFTGVIDRWNRKNPGEWEIVARPDWTILDGFVPRQAITKGDFPTVVTGTGAVSPYGIYFPQVYGTHDSAALTGKGMVPCPNLWYGGPTGLQWIYLIGHGQGKTLKVAYKDGVSSGAVTTVNTVLSGKTVFGISFNAASGVSTAVSADVDGIETVGNGTGTVILNPVAQLRHWLSNFGFADYKVGLWLTTHAKIDAASWSACETFATTYGFEGSMYIGGTASQVKVSDVIQNWLKSWPSFRLYWDHAGKLAMKYISPVLSMTGKQGDTFGPIREEDMIDFKTEMDTTQMLSRVGTSYVYGVKDGKFWTSIDVMDLAQSEVLTENVEALYSAGRFV